MLPHMHVMCTCVHGGLCSASVLLLCCEGAKHTAPAPPAPRPQLGSEAARAASVPSLTLRKLRLQAFQFTLSPLPVTLTGSFLMLLVTFRTNNSYLRFDEARKMWGLMLNRSRDTVRMAISFFPEDATQRKATFARWMIAFTICLKAHLRPGEDLRAEVSNLLSPNEQRVLLESDHKVRSPPSRARAMPVGVARRSRTRPAARSPCAACRC